MPSTMKQFVHEHHLDAALGICLLVFLAYAKVSELRARRNAVKLRATVVKVFPRRHSTSYYVRYTWNGAQRIAEYRGFPLVPSHQQGDELEILIDPDLTDDVPIPENIDDAPSAGVGGGTCSLAGEPVVSKLDLVWAAMAVLVIVTSFIRR